MKSAFITGANKSIGYETARQLLQKGYHVYLGIRTTENGSETVEKLKAEGLTIMAETNPNLRLEAFCDGVFAIALTLLIIWL